MGSGSCLAFFLFIAYDYGYYWQIPSLTPDYRNIRVLPSAPRIKFYKLMNILKNSWRKGTKLLSQLLCIGAVFTACTDEEVVNQADKAPLQVSVNTSLAKQSRSIVHGEWLPAGSTIGVSLFDTEGDDYDGQGYYNIQYKATGAEEDQTWASMGVTPAVSANEAVLVAYHPYNDDEDLDITAIPVEIASQTDYMYSGQVTGITNAAPKADIVLDHALTAIRFKLVLGDFTGDASVSEIAVASPALASSATLNAADGSLDNIAGQGDKFALPVDFGLVAGGTDNDIMFVPDAAVESGVTTVSATIGGKKYTAGIEFDEAYKQGYIYTYTLTLNNSGFAVTKVNVKPWETGTDDSAVLQPEKDDTYVIKIVAYNDYATNNEFVFGHNVVDFIGTIDWGDGTTDTYAEPVIYPTHVYPNDGQEYIVTAKGSIKELNVDGDPVGYGWINKSAESFCRALTEIVHIGKDCGIIYMHKAFFGCESLQTIPVGLFDKCTEVIDFSNAFQNTFIQTIPEGLFDKCTKVTNFEGTFAWTPVTEIPEGLFDKCTEVINFTGVFGLCENITEIPAGLFKYNTKVISFSHVFYNCWGLTSIPEGLFDNNPEVLTFSHAFYNISTLTTVPVNLFDYNRKVIDFERTFAYSDNITTESPYTIINVDGEDVKVHLYERYLYPEYFTAPTSYSGFYHNMSNSSIPDWDNIPFNWKGY